MDTESNQSRPTTTRFQAPGSFEIVKQLTMLALAPPVWIPETTAILAVATSIVDIKPHDVLTRSIQHVVKSRCYT